MRLVEGIIEQRYSVAPGSESQAINWDTLLMRPWAVMVIRLDGPAPDHVTFREEDGRTCTYASLSDAWFPLVVYSKDIGVRGTVSFRTKWMNENPENTTLIVQQFRTVEGYRAVYGKELERPGMRGGL